jgi:hypothetical protein
MLRNINVYLGGIVNKGTADKGRLHLQRSKGSPSYEGRNAQNIKD